MKVIFCCHKNAKDIFNILDEVQRYKEEIQSENKRLSNKNFNSFFLLDTCFSVLLVPLIFCYGTSQIPTSEYYEAIHTICIIAGGVVAAVYIACLCAYLSSGITSGIFVHCANSIYNFFAKTLIQSNSENIQKLNKIIDKLSYYKGMVRLVNELELILDIIDMPIQVKIIHKELYIYKVVFSFGEQEDQNDIVPDLEKINNVLGQVTYSMPEELYIVLDEDVNKILKKDCIDFSIFDDKVDALLKDYFEINPDSKFNIPETQTQSSINIDPADGNVIEKIVREGDTFKIITKNGESFQYDDNLPHLRVAPPTITRV